MTRLMDRMIKSKGNSGYVVFVTRAGMPGPNPTFGRPSGTREEATERASEFLASPVFTQAWTVGRDGIKEVKE